MALYYKALRKGPLQGWVGRHRAYDAPGDAAGGLVGGMPLL